MLDAPNCQISINGKSFTIFVNESRLASATKLLQPKYSNNSTKRCRPGHSIWMSNSAVLNYYIIELGSFEALLIQNACESTWICIHIKATNYGIYFHCYILRCILSEPDNVSFTFRFPHKFPSLNLDIGAFRGDASRFKCGHDKQNSFFMNYKLWAAMKRSTTPAHPNRYRPKLSSPRTGFFRFEFILN